MEGNVDSVRPTMMTVTAIIAGLLPIAWNTRTRSKVMQRIAVCPLLGRSGRNATSALPRKRTWAGNARIDSAA